MGRAGKTKRGDIAVGAGIVAALVGAAALNRQMAKRAERRHPPRGAFITVDGVRLHYLDSGGAASPPEATPIVLLHGNGVSVEDFVVSGLYDRLAQGRRVIAIDRPGFGYSERPRSKLWTAKAQAELIWHCLRQLDVGRAVILGHSWGTLVAVDLALAHGGEIAGLVLMSGYYRPTPRLDTASAMPALPGIGDVMRFTISPLIGRLAAPLVFRLIFSPARVADRFKAAFPTGMSLRPSQIRATSADTGLMTASAAMSYPERGTLRLPVLIITGDGDKIVSPKTQSEKLAADLPRAELIVIPGAGHMVHHTAPATVGAAIERFVSGLR